MSRLVTRRLFLASLAAAAASPACAAAEDSAVIRVADMHCANCAQKIARKLYAVPGVTKVSTDLKSHTATVTSQPGKKLSARAMWEAVEKAQFKVVQISTSAGVVKQKPKS